MLRVSGWTGNLTKSLAAYKRNNAMNGEHLNLSQMIKAMLPHGKGNHLKSFHSLSWLIHN